MNSTPLFSVIIPTYHRNDLLAKCLDCLAPGVQTLPAEQYEVIVTDDGSQTTAEEMIREKYPWAKWVAGPRKGPAANRNNGAKYAQGEWLAFTDDDCLPDRQWLEAYAVAIGADPSCLVFEGRTYVDRPRRSLGETSPINESGGYLWSCNFAIQKQLFKSLSGFDERFPYAAMEDVDLRLRITNSGCKYSFIKAASVCHPWRFQGGWKKLKQHQDSTFVYLSIHPEELLIINSIYYLRLAFYGFFKSTIPEILKLKFSGLIYALLEHLSFLQMAFFIWRYKRRLNP
ncbi:glycosyltransferase [Moorena sp. SIO3I6]|uniref:glycosyltransferase family 2 protein n=1 Tax=Moorena sp. SIO3I6 TaxID=2607831 RepID=UPI0013FAB534|nr:glycosyltransferase [Moorena sp. SIO3I6]NEO44549.1 glycosyltransferase [Moorena sp. SIO4A3]NEP25913.1 glycosyltransferase [Moorena sp. SIO3I6]